MKSLLAEVEAERLSLQRYTQLAKEAEDHLRILESQVSERHKDPSVGNVGFQVCFVFLLFFFF